MLLITKAKRPLKFKMLCGFNKHAVKLMPLFHQRIKPRSCRRPLIVHSRLKKDKNGREYWVGTEVWD